MGTDGMNTGRGRPEGSDRGRGPRRARGRPGLRRPAGVLLALVMAAGLPGCFSLSRAEPPQQHYVLGGTLLREDTAAPAAPSQALAGLAIGVRRTRLAPYLEPTFLVVREGQNEIAYSEYHRWGEQPGVGINRALAGHLQALAPFEAVHSAPWPPRERHDYLIQLHVEHFEGVAPTDGGSAGGEVHLRATWEIVRPLDGEVVAQGSTEYRQGGWVVGDFAGLVGLLDQGLAALAGEVVESLEGVVAPENPGA